MDSFSLATETCLWIFILAIISILKHNRYLQRRLLYHIHIYTSQFYIVNQWAMMTLIIFDVDTGRVFDIHSSNQAEAIEERTQGQKGLRTLIGTQSPFFLIANANWPFLATATETVVT